MPFDAKLPKKIIAAVEEHLSDFNLLKMVHSNGSNAVKQSLTTAELKNDQILNELFLLPKDLLVYVYCHLELFVCTLPPLWPCLGLK